MDRLSIKGLRVCGFRLAALEVTQPVSFICTNVRFGQDDVLTQGLGLHQRFKSRYMARVEGSRWCVCCDRRRELACRRKGGWVQALFSCERKEHDRELPVNMEEKQWLWACITYILKSSPTMLISADQQSREYTYM